MIIMIYFMIVMIYFIVYKNLILLFTFNHSY